MKKILFISTISLMLFGCDKDLNKELIEVNNEKITLYAGDSTQIVAKSNYPIEYKSENEFYANVNPEGWVIGRKVGETKIILSCLEEIKEVIINVEPRNTLYPDPILDRNMTSNNIKSVIGKPFLDEDKQLTYLNYTDKLIWLFYGFDDNDQLNSVVIYVDKIYCTSVDEYLSERYVMYSEEDDGSKFYYNANCNEDATWVISSVPSEHDLWNINYTLY